MHLYRFEFDLNYELYNLLVASLLLLSGTFLWQGPKMRERPKSPIGFIRSLYCGESSPKFQMYNEQKANGAWTIENQNANNKSAEKA